MSEERKQPIDRAGLKHPEEAEVELFGVVEPGDEAAQPKTGKRAEAAKGTRGFFAWLAYHFSSLVTTVVVLCIIVGFSVIGTVVPQGEPVDRYVTQYGVQKARILTLLGFTDIYHTIYFNLLLAWIGLSALWCTVERSIRTWKLQFTPRIKIRASTIEKLKHHRVISVKDGSASIDLYEAKLRKAGWRTYRLKGEDDTHNLYAARGMRRMWVLVILHIGIIVVLLGALVGLFFGTNGNVRLEDGETMLLTIHPAEADYAVSQGIDSKPTAMGGMKQATGRAKPKFFQRLLKNVKPMTFTLDLDEFEITYDKLIKTPLYAEGGSEVFKEYESFIVHQFTSRFTVTRNGRTRSKIIKVNYPLSLDKIMFYQSAFDRTIEIKVTTLSGESFTEMVGMNVPFVVTPSGIQPVMGGNTFGSPFVLVIQDVKEGPWYSGKKLMGELTPMVQMGFFDARSGQSMGTEILKKGSPLDLSSFTLELGDRIKSASIFQYKRDPGLPLIYLGFLMLFLGALGSLALKFRQVFICISGGKARLGMRSSGIVENTDKFFDVLTG
jgi:cytochrome c biogenesis protein ResB